MFYAISPIYFNSQTPKPPSSYPLPPLPEGPVGYSPLQTTQSSTSPMLPNLCLSDPKLSQFSLSNTENEDTSVSKENKKITRSFHSRFTTLKQSLEVGNSRKTHLDSLLKKAKSKCLKAIHEVLKNCLNLIVGRLPQDFITNVKIDFNQNYLNKKVKDIYIEFNLLPTVEEINNKKLIRKGKSELLNEILNMQLKNTFAIYLDSELYFKDLEKIERRDGKKIATLYDYVSKNMCDYFLLSKGNKKKLFQRRKKNKKMFHINNSLSQNNK